MCLKTELSITGVVPSSKWRALVSESGPGLFLLLLLFSDKRSDAAGGSQFHASPPLQDKQAAHVITDIASTSKCKSKTFIKTFIRTILKKKVDI